MIFEQGGLGRRALGGAGANVERQVDGSALPVLLSIGIGLGALALQGCDGEEETGRAGSENLAVESAASPLAGKSWLEVHDGEAPELWLAARDAPSGMPPAPETVTIYRELLARADRSYGEGPRMIANRSVQLQAMLAGLGIEEGPRPLIEALVAAANANERQNFGETCQHYFNLRRQGLGKEAALAGLDRSTAGPVAP